MNYSIVIPVYNSSKTLPVLVGEISAVMKDIDDSYEVIFVDDCSPDESWAVLKQLHQEDNQHIRILRLANNVGQWLATLAGISKAKGKLILTIDDDLEYDTKDIGTLIRAYQNSNKYLIYGIPVEKKNKNLSYKLFFKIRDRLLRVFFNKMQTESFKIFKREIYFDHLGELYSNTHFEAYTKFVVSPKYVGHVNVNYRSRYFGNSNHTLWLKLKLLLRFGIEYYKAPFKLPLYLLLFLFTAYFVLRECHLSTIGMHLIQYLIALNFLFIIGISGNYLSSLYHKIKGIPVYVIVEEY
jgi:glycosyltransferase involved in cell wall biosynthesis